MRILQLVSSSGFYGAERMVSLLSTALNSTGEEVCLGLFNATDPSCAQTLREADQRNIPVWNLSCRGRFDWRTVYDLVQFLKTHRIDVLHTHGYKANTYGLIGARIAGCAVVATCHNWTQRTASLRRYEAVDRLFLRWFDSVIAVSQGIVSDLHRSGVRRVRMIANGIDITRYRVEDRVPGINEQLVLGCVSRLSKEKGVDVLLWALPKLLRSYPYLRCIVAGDGPERERLTALAAKLGVSGSFHMPGFCENTAEFLRLCTAVVQPSRIEAMPLAILEAMAAGKAIVASAVGEIPRLLEDGHAGMLVPPDNPELLADAVMAVLSDEALKQRLEHRAAQKAIEQFDVTRMATEYQKVYRVVASRCNQHGYLTQAGRLDIKA